MNPNEYEYNLYLAHHGVKGQRWGVRRFQNEDGSLTAKGKKRYGSDLDINDKSRENIARIRLGEARRRLDTAKANNDTNKARIAELKGKERAAKRAVKAGKKFDKGAKLAAKGQTIWGNKAKTYAVSAATGVGSALLTYGLNKSLARLSADGRLTQAHYNLAKAINNIGGMTLTAASVAYGLKKSSDNSHLRSYENAKYSGAGTIKRVGGEEYQDVVERRKKGK